MHQKLTGNKIVVKNILTKTDEKLRDASSYQMVKANGNGFSATLRYMGKTVESSDNQGLPNNQIKVRRLHKVSKCPENPSESLKDTIERNEFKTCVQDELRANEKPSYLKIMHLNGM